MMDYNQLEALVIEWADQKSILNNGTPLAQSKKTMEECQELIDAIEGEYLGRETRDEIADALGDILVTIIIQAKMQNMSLLECLEGAYNVITKRTGKMVNGQFVKDA
jgi:NTP pyrophosphatase (non-canonical NTP hydrolase)